MSHFLVKTWWSVACLVWLSFNQLFCSPPLSFFFFLPSLHLSFWITGCCCCCLIRTKKGRYSFSDNDTLSLACIFSDSCIGTKRLRLKNLKCQCNNNWTVDKPNFDATYIIYHCILKPNSVKKNYEILIIFWRLQWYRYWYMIVNHCFWFLSEEKKEHWTVENTFGKEMDVWMFTVLCCTVLYWTVHRAGIRMIVQISGSRNII